MMGRSLLTVCLLSSTFVGGCALRAPSAHDAGDRKPDEAGALSDYIASVQRAMAAARPPRAAGANRLEERDADLFALRAAVQVAPTADRHRLLAEAYARRGVLDAAFDHFTAAIKLSPKSGAAYEGRARIWRDWGQPQMGLADAHRAIYRSPDQPGPQNTLGTLLLKMGLFREARGAFKEALARSPRADYALNNLCYVHLMESRAEDAIDACRDALAIAPGSKTARNNLALAYAATGDSRAAYREFAHDGDVAAASYNMGIALAAVGRFPEAARAFDTAWRLDPRQLDARDRARQLASRTASAGQ
jgi:tetratricopeptide (TPR) repeat protein